MIHVRGMSLGISRRDTRSAKTRKDSGQRWLRRNRRGSDGTPFQENESANQKRYFADLARLGTPSGIPRNRPREGVDKCGALGRYTGRGQNHLADPRRTESCHDAGTVSPAIECPTMTTAPSPASSMSLTTESTQSAMVNVFASCTWLASSARQIDGKHGEFRSQAVDFADGEVPAVAGMHGAVDQHQCRQPHPTVGRRH